jgi:hypothetical protein
MNPRVPTLTPIARHRPFAAGSRLAVAAVLALVVGVGGGFVAGRATTPDARDEVRSPTSLDGGGSKSDPEFTIPAHHPRVKWEGAGPSRGSGSSDVGG